MSPRQRVNSGGGGAQCNTHPNQWRRLLQCLCPRLHQLEAAKIYSDQHPPSKLRKVHTGLDFFQLLFQKKKNPCVCVCVCVCVQLYEYIYIYIYMCVCVCVCVCVKQLTISLNLIFQITYYWMDANHRRMQISLSSHRKKVLVYQCYLQEITTLPTFS